MKPFGSVDNKHEWKDEIGRIPLVPGAEGCPEFLVEVLAEFSHKDFVDDVVCNLLIDIV